MSRVPFNAFRRGRHDNYITQVVAFCLQYTRYFRTNIADGTNGRYRRRLGEGK